MAAAAGAATRQDTMIRTISVSPIFKQPAKANALGTISKGASLLNGAGGRLRLYNVYAHASSNKY